MGLFELLLLIMIVLKVLGYISLSWWTIAGICAVPTIVMLAVFFFVYWRSFR